jgi:GH15 family glucan-1,4-alpha-glucosidase
MYPGSSELDAAVLRAVPWGYYSDKARLRGTIRAIKEELSAGPLIYRYTGMQQEEGCFVACSFWLVHAIVEVGEVEEAEKLLDQLVDLATPLGLYAEQIDPTSGQMLGNFPQALSHLALISAAHRVSQAHGESGSGRREM